MKGELRILLRTAFLRHDLAGGMLLLLLLLLLMMMMIQWVVSSLQWLRGVVAARAQDGPVPVHCPLCGRFNSTNSFLPLFSSLRPTQWLTILKGATTKTMVGNCGGGGTY